MMTNMSFLGNITFFWRYYAQFDQCKQWCLNTKFCYGIINESNKSCPIFGYDAESKNNLSTEDWGNMQIMHKSKWCWKCGRKLSEKNGVSDFRFHYRNRLNKIKLNSYFLRRFKNNFVDCLLISRICIQKGLKQIFTPVKICIYQSYSPIKDLNLYIA